MDAAKNFAKGTLVAGIQDTDTTLSVLTGEGARFPAPPFNAVIWDSTDYPDPADAYYSSTGQQAEVVRVTAISGDDLTITRGQEGTDAVPLALAGKTYQIIAPWTAKVVNTDLFPVSRLSDSGTDFIIAPGEAAELALDFSNGISQLGDTQGVGEGTKIHINDPATQITFTKQPIFPDLPSSDPAVAGALYYDAVTGIVKRSAG